MKASLSTDEFDDTLFGQWYEQGSEEGEVNINDRITQVLMKNKATIIQKYFRRYQQCKRYRLLLKMAKKIKMFFRANRRKRKSGDTNQFQENCNK